MSLKDKEYTDEPDPDARYFLHHVIEDREPVTKLYDIDLCFAEVIARMLESPDLVILLSESFYDSRAREVVVGSSRYRLLCAVPLT